MSGEPARNKKRGVCKKNENCPFRFSRLRHSRVIAASNCARSLASSLVWALWHGLDVPHVWDIWGGFISLTPILDISTALMRPRRPKQYCLQLVIYIYNMQNNIKKWRLRHSVLPWHSTSTKHVERITLQWMRNCLSWVSQKNVKFQTP